MTGDSPDSLTDSRKLKLICSGCERNALRRAVRLDCVTETAGTRVVSQQCMQQFAPPTLGGCECHLRTRETALTRKKKQDTRILWRPLPELRCTIATQKKENGLSQREGRRAVWPKHRCGRPDAWRRRNAGQSQRPVRSQHPAQ